MPLFQLTYASSATRPFSDGDLIALLQRTREKNQASGLSGMLLYRDGNFLQVLEGEESAVRAVHAKIQGDPRHFGLLTLLQGPIAERNFSDWSMGFRNLDSDEVRSVPGYSEFLNDDWMSVKMRENPSRAARLLDVFRRNMR